MPDSWETVLTRIKTVFELDADPAKLPTLTEAIALPPSVPQVSRDFAFTEQPDDKVHFRYHHVEPLLDETAALLDRSLSDRAAYFQFSTEFFRAKQEIIEFLRLDSIHDEERAANVYELPHAEAESALAPCRALYPSRKDQSDNVGKCCGMERKSSFLSKPCPSPHSQLSSGEL